MDGTPRIKRPQRGACFRIVRGSYIDGIFLVDGKKVLRSLCKIADIELGPSGKRRTPKQLNDLIQNLWEDKRSELGRTLAIPRPNQMPVSLALDDWIAHTKAKGRTASTLRELERAKRYYLEIVGDHAVGDASTLHADRFMQGLIAKGLSPASVNPFLSRISTFWRFAHNRGLIASLPRAERVKVPAKVAQIPSPEEVTKLLTHLQARIENARSKRERYYRELHRLFALVLIGTGMRSGEAIAIRRDQVDLERRAISLVRTKTNTPRICRIPKLLAEEIERHFRDYPFHQFLFGHPKKPDRQAWQTTSSLSHGFTRHYAEIGIQGDFKPLHGFRALYATAGLNNVGVDPLAMMSQIGHADLQTTRTYYVASMQDAQLRAVDAIEEGFLAGLMGAAEVGKSEGK